MEVWSQGSSAFRKRESGVKSEWVELGFSVFGYWGDWFSFGGGRRDAECSNSVCDRNRRGSFVMYKVPNMSR